MGPKNRGAALNNNTKDSSAPNTPVDGQDPESIFREENAKATTAGGGGGGGGGRASLEAFAQPIGYIPRFAEHPKYIKVRAKGKKDMDFDRLFLAQTLRGRTGREVAEAGGRKIPPSDKVKRGETVWALQFSKDGRYLAAGGHDHIVRVWAVLASEEDRQAHEQDEVDKSGNHSKLSAPVFRARPVQEYEGHTETILDLSWSKVGR